VGGVSEEEVPSSRVKRRGHLQLGNCSMNPSMEEFGVGGFRGRFGIIWSDGVGASEDSQARGRGLHILQRDRSESRSE